MLLFRQLAVTYMTSDTYGSSPDTVCPLTCLQFIWASKQPGAFSFSPAGA